MCILRADHDLLLHRCPVIVLNHIEAIICSSFRCQVLPCPLGNDFVNIAAVLQFQQIAAEGGIFFFNMLEASKGDEYEKRLQKFCSLCAMWVTYLPL